MKYNLLLKILLVFGLFVFSCSTDDDVKVTINAEGGTVYRYQIVVIESTGAAFSEEEYTASFGGTNVTLIKTDDYHLNFVVPTDAPLGVTKLSISELSNVKINYTVLQPNLSQSVVETVNTFISVCDSRFADIEEITLEEGIAQNNYQQFKNYFQENATSAEREQIALFYQTNKPLIDSVILYNLNSSGRFSYQDVTTIMKFLGAVIVTTGGGTVAVFAPETSLKVLGVAIIGIGIANAIKYHDELESRNIKIIAFNINGAAGNNDKIMSATASNQITLTDNLTTSLFFQLGARQLKQSDSNGATGHILTFYTTQIKYNNMIVKVNNLINWINNNVPLLNFSPFSQASLNSNPSTVNEVATTEIMQDVTFKINHPNLKLESAEVENDGQLKLKVKIIGTPSTTPISSTLTYIYKDEVSNISGGFPIVVVQQGADSMQMIFVEGGTFLMGEVDTDNYLDSNEPRHPVTINSFKISSTEVTVGQYQAFCTATGRQMPNLQSYYTSQHPIGRVSWEDIHAYCSWLSIQHGVSYRLPTEAEWEYAAKGGNQSMGYIYSGSDNASLVAWGYNNTADTIMKVALLQPNELGIYDMSGNVAEICSDWYSKTYYQNSPSTNPTGPAVPGYGYTSPSQTTVSWDGKVVRGGGVGYLGGEIVLPLTERYSGNTTGQYLYPVGVTPNYSGLYPKPSIYRGFRVVSE